MLSYILKRIALMLPTLLGVLTVAFVVIQFVPGGPVEQIMAQARMGAGGAYKARGDVDAKQVEALKKLYGFDKPAPVRYVEMLKNFATFDLGTSFMQSKPVWSLIKEKLPVSISLGLWTFLISYLISVPLGIAKAVREGSRFDAVSTFFVMFGYKALRFAFFRESGFTVTRAGEWAELCLALGFSVFALLQWRRLGRTRGDEL